jgi:methionine synthase I (cobalamin-dependent)
MQGGAPAIPAQAIVESDVFEYLHSLCAQRIVIIDGAMGTMIQTHKLGEAE